jgi:hypothetical protein
VLSVKLLGISQADFHPLTVDSMATGGICATTDNPSYGIIIRIKPWLLVLINSLLSDENAIGPMSIPANDGIQETTLFGRIEILGDLLSIAHQDVELDLLTFEV